MSLPHKPRTIAGGSWGVYMRLRLRYGSTACQSTPSTTSGWKSRICMVPWVRVGPAQVTQHWCAQAHALQAAEVVASPTVFATASQGGPPPSLDTKRWVVREGAYPTQHSVVVYGGGVLAPATFAVQPSPHGQFRRHLRRTTCVMYVMNRGGD